MERVNPAPCPPEGCLVHRPPPQRSQSQRSRPPQAWGSIRVFAKDHRRVPCILVQAACPVPCWDGWGRRGPGKVSRALGAGCGVGPCSRAALLLTGCLLVALSSRLGCCLPYVFGGSLPAPQGSRSASPHVPRFPSGSGHSPIGFFRLLVLACAGGVRLAFVLLFPLAFAFPLLGSCG